MRVDSKIVTAVIEVIDPDRFKTAGRLIGARKRLVRDILRAGFSHRAASAGRKSRRVLTPEQARAAREGRKQPPAEGGVPQ